MNDTFDKVNITVLEDCMTLYAFTALGLRVIIKFIFDASRDFYNLSHKNNIPLKVVRTTGQIFSL